MKNTSNELLELATVNNLCSEWIDGWGEPDLDELVQKYIEGIDFCILHNYPSNEYIKSHFGKVAEKHGVYTDAKIDLSNPEIAILNGNCTGNISLSGYVARTIYVRHSSNMKITIKDNARASIYIHDSAQAIIDNKGTNRVFVYKYGNACKAFTSGDVLVRERQEL